MHRLDRHSPCPGRDGPDSLGDGNKYDYPNTCFPDGQPNALYRHGHSHYYTHIHANPYAHSYQYNYINSFRACLVYTFVYNDILLDTNDDPHGHTFSYAERNEYADRYS